MVSMAHMTILFWGLLATAVAGADVGDEVRCREIGFSQSVENQDIDAFRSYIDADARFVSNSVLRGPDAIAAAWQVFFEAQGPTIKWRPQFVEVLENGRLALTRGPYRMLTRDSDGAPVERWGTFNSIWRLQDDGQWRVVFDAGNAADAPPDAATQALLDDAENCP